MFPLADKILECPDAVFQLQYLQKAMKEETVRRKEFYDWVTEGMKAEFINGEVIVHTPVNTLHWTTSSLLSSLISCYTTIKKLGSVGTNIVMISLSRNDYEPDLVFFSQEKVETFTGDQVRFPAPDFVVEILSPSTAKQDRTTKKDDYALHGIQEYWIVNPEKQQVEQYILPNGSTSYFPAKIHKRGQTIVSKAISGFEIDVAAIFDESENLKAVQSFMKNS